MSAHLARYAEAYFKALLYLTLQYALAIVACPSPEAGAYGHLLYFARLSTLALPAMLAFMDGSVQRGRAAPPAPGLKSRPELIEERGELTGHPLA